MYDVVTEEEEEEDTLPDICAHLKELKETSIEKEISGSHITDIIFVLSIHDICSYKFHQVEGINNVWYVRNREGVPFQSFPRALSVSYTVMHDIRKIQTVLYSQLNNSRIGEKLVSRIVIDVHPCSWEYLKWKSGVDVIFSRRKKAEKVFIPPFGKKKMSTLVDVQSIKFVSEESLIPLKGMIGRYVGVGAQSRFPKLGDPAQWINRGTTIHKVCTDENDYILFQFNTKDRTLVIKCTYSKITASDPRYNNIIF